MSYVAACLVRDWRISRTRGAAFTLDLAAVLLSAVVFYYLSRYVGRGASYFPFVVAGLTILRLHTAVPRVLAATTARIADGSLEILVSGRPRAATALIGEAAFELLRGLALSALLLIVAVGLLGADVELTAAGVAAVVIGLAGAGVILLGLTVALAALLLVLREAGALASLSGVLLPILGGAYFPISTMPAPLEGIATALPFHWPVDVIRQGLLDGRFPVADVLGLVAASAISLGLAAAAVEPAVRRARRTGRLALE